MNLKTLGWAAYLAVSWTWCIGMFFPVLLVRDYGIWGFVVFAVPNVVGAAAMGWVLCRDGMSEHLVHRHRHAMVAFSAVTAAFHLFWIGNIIELSDERVTRWLLPFGVLGAIAVMGYLVWSAKQRRKSEREQHHGPAIAIVTLAVSVIVALILAARGELQILDAPSASTVDLVSLAWPCLLGFLLCPYLDLTFHRARQQTSRVSARFAFGIGFGVFFLAMILFTLGYTGPLGSVLAAAGTTLTVGMSTGVVIHTLVQTFATLALHGRQVELHRPNYWFRAAAFGGLLLSFVAGLRTPGDGAASPLISGELIYRCFMVFYGLVFPAYVWLCMWPTRDGHSGIKGRDGRRNRLVLAGVVGLAVPFYWTGFIERQEPWLVGGVAVVLLGRLFVGRSGVKTSGRAIAVQGP